MTYLNPTLIALVLSNTLVAQSPCIIASYPFDGNANDVTGNGHDGTVFGATLGTDRFGTDNACYQFDGIDDYIDISGNWTGSNGTISAYIYLDDLDGYRPIFTHDDGQNLGNALTINIDPSFSPDSGWLWFAVDQRECLGGPTLYFTETEPQPQTGEWVHIAVTADDDSVHLYLNCVEVQTYLPDGLTNPGLWFDDLCSGPFTTLIGSSGIPPSSFKGRIDDLKVFNCALSPSELDSLCQPDFSTSIGTPRYVDGIAAYPNPTNGLTRIAGLSHAESMNIRVVDATGRIVHVVQQWHGNDLLIDLSAVPSGVIMLLFNAGALRLIRE